MVTSTLCLRLISSNLQIRSLQIKKQNLFCLELRRVCDFCVAVFLNVLCSLCHTEYWLGGRWSHGSCLAMLTTFFFNFIFDSNFYFLILITCSPTVDVLSLSPLTHPVH